MKAVLISWTADPIQTVLKVWEASKTEKSLKQIEAEVDNPIPEYAREMEALFVRILDQGIPVSQNIVFNFICEDVPISWREQAVRHRIGVKYGDNFAVDIVPEMDASFWSQSMRIQDMSQFAGGNKYHTPDSIATKPEAKFIYADAMRRIERAYQMLLAEGIPMEDARNLIPLGATHRISMTVNLQALQHIIGKRGCWILQGDLWHPIIESMIQELVDKVHPVFRRLVKPPCVDSSGEFRTCVFKEENIRRVNGDDALPVCPLYANERDGSSLYSLSPQQQEAAQQRIPQYAKFWDQPELKNTWQWERRI